MGTGGNAGTEKRKIGNNMAGFCVEKWAVLEYDNNIVVQWRCPGNVGLTQVEKLGKTGKNRGNRRQNAQKRQSGNVQVV